MSGITQTLASDPFWLWLVVGAAILAVEIMTGTGWLLWAAIAAGAVGLLALATHTTLPIELAVFAALTSIMALAARRFLPSSFTEHGPDINDNIGRVVGKRGQAASAFKAGAGRVSIDGKEWAAQLEGEGALASGSAVEVVAVEGSHLMVKAL